MNIEQFPQNQFETGHIEGGDKNQPERTYLNKLFKMAIKKIINIVPEALKLEDKDVKKLRLLMEQSSDLSIGAGKFFRELIPASLHKPKLEYVHKNRDNRFDDELTLITKALKEVKEKLGEEAYDFSKGILLRKVSDVFDGPIEETKLEEGSVVQEKISAIKQDGGSNLIQEEITNYLLEVNGKKMNSPVSELVVNDNTTGLSIDLTQLLPAEHSFAPSDLIIREKVWNEEKQKREIITTPVALDSYQGAAETQGDFYHDPAFKKVVYGNLKEKGGMLALLHETAHSWQNVHIGDSPVGNYKMFVRDAGYHLGRLMRSKRMIDKGQEKTSIDWRQVREESLSELKNLDVDFDENNFIYKNQTLKDDEMTIDHTMTLFGEEEKIYSFIIKKEIVERVTEDYIRQERDAWAHAIRTLRFLRSQGMDLEPQMQTADDIKEYVHDCLETYQRSIERNIVPTGKYRKFTNRMAA